MQPGDRVAMLLPQIPEAAAAFLGVWKAGGILLSLSVLYGDDGIRHRVRDSQASSWSPTPPTATRVDADLTEQVIELSPGDLDEGSTDVEVADTAADDPAQLYYTSGTTGLAKGILHAHRYLLAHEEFTYCHDVSDGVRFRGMGEWAWAAGIAPLLGPVADRRGPGRRAARRAASTPTASSTRCRATASRTSSRRRRRCAR